MLDKILNKMEEFIEADRPLLRKLRVFKYVICIIILFVAFCNSYWNLLEYVDVPDVPLFAEQFRNILHSSVMPVWILWGVYSTLYHNLYKVFHKKFWVEISYVYILIDFLLTIYFFIYVANLVIEFVNGLTINVCYEAIFAVVYLLYCILHSSYALHKIRYEESERVVYTGFCDSKGVPIPEDAKVFYKGKQHKVEEYDGAYRLLPHGEKWIGSDSIKLEHAACDPSGKLFLAP